MHMLPYENEWQIATRFLLRITGFPLKLMDRLQFSTSATLIRQSLLADTPSRQMELLNRAESAFERELTEKTTELQAITASPMFRARLLILSSM